jgi:presenilin-like A22 family membrane protease
LLSVKGGRFFTYRVFEKRSIQTAADLLVPAKRCDVVASLGKAAACWCISFEKCFSLLVYQFRKMLQLACVSVSKNAAACWCISFEKCCSLLVDQFRKMLQLAGLSVSKNAAACWCISFENVFGALAKLRKATINFVMPVRTGHLGSHWADFD